MTDAAKRPRRRCERCRAQYRVPADAPDATTCAPCRGEAPKVGRPPAAVRALHPGIIGNEDDLNVGDEGMTAVGGVEDAARDELKAAGRLDHPLGRAYLKLARELDKAAGNVAQQIAGRLTALREQALAGAPRTADAVDELQARRRAAKGA